LLDVELVNANGVMRVDFAGADCNLTTATIEGLTTARLDIIHRFIRLQRKLGWPIHEVSNALAAFSATNIDDESLLELARVNDL
jgi:hypothetical protein